MDLECEHCARRRRHAASNCVAAVGCAHLGAQGTPRRELILFLAVRDRESGRADRAGGFIRVGRIRHLQEAREQGGRLLHQSRVGAHLGEACGRPE